jgi:hypothetical protein
MGKDRCPHPHPPLRSILPANACARWSTSRISEYPSYRRGRMPSSTMIFRVTWSPKDANRTRQPLKVILILSNSASFIAFLCSLSVLFYRIQTRHYALYNIKLKYFSFTGLLRNVKDNRVRCSHCTCRTTLTIGSSLQGMLA